jgi:hypothetical protein
MMFGYGGTGDGEAAASRNGKITGGWCWPPRWTAP